MNGANFVYYGMFIRGLDGPKEKALVEYAKQVKRRALLNFVNIELILLFGKDGTSTVVLIKVY